uniref:Peptidase S1 domain-containing protein n=1 Tax=Hyaloperonospora arabidopsidis (strain Emoy2) TaxID=559515 RepID=M4BK09_HYAAE
MKCASAFVAGIATLAVTVLTTTAFTDAVERKLILGGSTVPRGRKSYYAGLRNTMEGQNFCGGALISPKHVLTAAHCVELDIRWVSIGSHYNNGSEDGEQILIVAVIIHPNYTEPHKFSNDYAILELEVASSIKPAKLAKADDSDFKAGAIVNVVGTGHLSEGLGAVDAHELQRVDMTLITNQECDADGRTTTDMSMVCVAGQISKGWCDGDFGGPIFVESSDDDDSDDVVIGLVSWRSDGSATHGCGRGKSLPMINARVSHVREWIEAIRTTSCFV